MSSALLPINATATERALDAATARISTVPVPITQVWSPHECPSALLPWLAWAFDVAGWDAAWPEDAKRASIAASVQVHRLKGSVWSVKQAIANAGYGDATLTEGVANARYDAAHQHDAAITYGNLAEWATYRLQLASPISNEQADQVRRLLAGIAPLRCHLVELIYTRASPLYNGAIFYDGSYNHGVA